MADAIKVGNVQISPKNLDPKTTAKLGLTPSPSGGADTSTVITVNGQRKANPAATLTADDKTNISAKYGAQSLDMLPKDASVPVPPTTPTNTPPTTTQPSPTTANATPYTNAAPAVSDAQAQQNLAQGGLGGTDLASAQKSLSAYQQGHQATAGTAAPQDAGAGMSAATSAANAISDDKGYVSPAPVVQALTDAHQKTMDDYKNFISSQGQGKSLVQQYKDFTNQLGIPALNTELINMKNVIDGTEDDIRNEVTKANGFATDSQVLAMTNARNKQTIINYNNLLQTRSDLQAQVTTMVGLATQDRAYASSQIDRQLNFDQAQETFAQKALTNAQDSYTKTADTYGWDAVYKSAMASGDPKAVDKINATMGSGFDLQSIAGKTPMAGYQVVKGGTDAFGNALPDSIFNTKTGQFSNAPTQDTTGAQSGGSTGSGDPVDAAMQAIVGNESGGSYSALSKKLPNGSQSYGKYQVLDSNIPSWTKAATGTAMTPQQFLASPSAQDAVAKQQIGNLWNKYGNIADVASVWFTGQPAAKSGGAVDPTTGTTQPQYIAKATAAFNKLMASTSNSAEGTQANATSGANFERYGLLSKTNFNPGNMVDGLAQKYLDQYIKNGTVPTASSLGRSMKPEAMAQVDARARELYYQATGSSMPNPEVIKGYQQQLIGNNKLQNSLNIQEGVVGKNAALLLQNLKANNLNDNTQPINSFIDNMKNMLGDPAVGQYLAQNATVSNELGSLLSLKNAQGTTVHDKLEAAGIINKSDNQAQITAKVKVLLQEAVNSHDAINQASASLYAQTDPLMQDSNNPLRQQTKNSNFVSQSLISQGLHYDNLMAEMTPQTPAGHQPALDASTGNPVFATLEEIKSGKYIPL